MSQQNHHRRSKDFEDLKRPPNVSSDEETPEETVHSVKTDESLDSIKTNLRNVENNDELRDGNENKDNPEGNETRSFTEEPDNFTQNTAKFGERNVDSTENLTDQDIDNSSKLVPNDNKNKNGKGNDKDGESPNKTQRITEKSASQTNLLNMIKTDPKNTSTQTLPSKSDKPSKKRSSIPLLSSIRKYLTKKKAKSISKCESANVVWFANNSLQNIYSDTWNRQQHDLMKRESFDDELLETFRKAKLEQMEAFIANEKKTAKGSGENNFEYLKNMNEKSSEQNEANDKIILCLAEEIATNITNECTRTDIINPKEVQNSEDSANKESVNVKDKKGNVLMVSNLKEVLIVDNHFDTTINQQLRKTNDTSLTSSKKQDFEGNEIIDIEINKHGIENTRINPNALIEHNCETNVVFDVKRPFETSRLTDNTEDSLLDSQKLTEQVDKRSHNANSVPIQVVHDKTEDPCGDIIVHVDSDKVYDGENLTQFQKDDEVNGNTIQFEIQDTDYTTQLNKDVNEPIETNRKRTVRIGQERVRYLSVSSDENNVLSPGDFGSKFNKNICGNQEISEDIRMNLIKEIDKIFENEGLNLTFESESASDANDDESTQCLDKDLLKVKQKEILERITRNSPSKDKEKSNFSMGEHFNITAIQNPSNVDTHNKITDSKRNKLTKEFSNARNMVIQKTIPLQTALSNSENEDDEEQFDDSPENDILDIQNHPNNLEEFVLRNSLHHKTLKAKSAPENFSVNPLFDEDDNKSCVSDTIIDRLKMNDIDENISPSISVDLLNNGVKISSVSYLEEPSFPERKTPESGYSSTVETMFRASSPEVQLKTRQLPISLEIMNDQHTLSGIGPSETSVEQIKTHENYCCPMNMEKDEPGDVETFGTNELDTEFARGKSFPDVDKTILLETTLECDPDQSTPKKTTQETLLLPKILVTKNPKKSELPMNNQSLLEPGNIIDDRIIMERRKLILNSGKPSSSEQTPKSVNYVPDLSAELNKLSEGFVKLQRVFSRSVENLDEVNNDNIKNSEVDNVHTYENVANQVKSTERSDVPITKKSLDIGGYHNINSIKTQLSIANVTGVHTGRYSADVSPSKNLSIEPCETDYTGPVTEKTESADVVLSYSKLKELSNSRNTLNFNTRL